MPESRAGGRVSACFRAASLEAATPPHLLRLTGVKGACWIAKSLRLGWNCRHRRFSPGSCQPETIRSVEDEPQHLQPQAVRRGNEPRFPRSKRLEHFDFTYRDPHDAFPISVIHDQHSSVLQSSTV